MSFVVQSTVPGGCKPVAIARLAIEATETTEISNTGNGPIRGMAGSSEGRCVLVTGGAGYIGSHCCVDLLQAGYDVVVVSPALPQLLPCTPRSHAALGRHPAWRAGAAGGRGARGEGPWCAVPSRACQGACGVFVLPWRRRVCGVRGVRAPAPHVRACVRACVRASKHGRVLAAAGAGAWHRNVRVCRRTTFATPCPHRCSA